MYGEEHTQRLTLANLKAMSDDVLYQSILDYVANQFPVPEVDDTDSSMTMRAVLLGLPKCIRAYFLAATFESQCAGDGLDSFFYNGSATDYDLTLEALNVVGAEYQTNALEDVMKLIDEEAQRRPTLQPYLLQRDFIGMFSNEDLGAWSKQFVKDFNRIEGEIVRRDGEVRERCLAYARANLEAFAVE